MGDGDESSKLACVVLRALMVRGRVLSASYPSHLPVVALFNSYTRTLRQEFAEAKEEFVLQELW